MSHNRDRIFRSYYDELTVAQLLLIDDNILSYIKMTNPWGSDESAKPTRKTPEPTMADAHRLGKTKLKGEVVIEQTRTENLPVHLREQIKDFKANRQVRTVSPFASADASQKKWKVRF
jgi:hypothetical protein